jgi:hypothetical protein
LVGENLRDPRSLTGEQMSPLPNVWWCLWMAILWQLESLPADLQRVRSEKRELQQEIDRLRQVQLTILSSSNQPVAPQIEGHSRSNFCFAPLLVLSYSTIMSRHNMCAGACEPRGRGAPPGDQREQGEGAPPGTHTRAGGRAATGRHTGVYTRNVYSYLKPIPVDKKDGCTLAQCHAQASASHCL